MPQRHNDLRLRGQSLQQREILERGTSCNPWLRPILLRLASSQVLQLSPVWQKKDNYKYGQTFRDENGEWVSDREAAEDTEQCEKNEEFCMEQTNDQ